MLTTDSALRSKPTMATIELSDFGISKKTGFVPEKPVPKIAGLYFSKWEYIAEHLPELLKRKKLRAAVDELPETEFSSNTLHSDNEWRRAYAILSFISQAYIWEGGESGAITELPAKIAVPWHATSQYIGVPPAATYAATIFFNYSMKVAANGLDSSNLKAALTFTGTEDESWFYMIHVLSEFAAVPGLVAIESGLKAMASNDDEKLMKNLRSMHESIIAMKNTLTRMYEQSDPKFYYNTLRYFFGCPEGGLIFSGVSDERKTYRGGSGAQDTAIPAFGVFLGIKHNEKERALLEDFKKYMPPKHREFLEVLSRQPSVRDYVLKSANTELLKRYNEVVDALVSFRSEHRILVTRFIINMKQSKGEKVTETVKGMGGTSFMIFLKKLKDETASLKLQEP